MTTWTWTGGTSGAFNTPTNWNPHGIPDNSGPTHLHAGDSVTIANNVHLGSIVINGGAGTATLGGAAFQIETDSGVTLAAGQTLNFAGATLKDDSGVTVNGAGNHGFSNGTMNVSTGVSLSAGKILTLTNITWNSTSGISGAGTVSLHGTTMNFTGAYPTVNFSFATVFAGDTFNHLNLPSVGGPLGNISNLGYGSTINAGGFNLSLVSIGGGVYHLVSSAPGNPVISNHVTLSPGTNVNDFTNSGGNFFYNGPPPCFCAGTRILTDRGEVPVEELHIGDLVVTASGEARPIRWIGHTAPRASAGRGPEAASPIRIASDAFGAGLPVRDLWVSPGHCIAWKGALIPVDALRNGRTIASDPRKSPDYWHVELDAHDVILAEGLPVESYLDTGNRIAFANGREFRELAEKPRHWSETCLPYAASGSAVEDARAELLERAKALGHRVTNEADMHVVADGRRIDPIRLSANRYLFVLPPDPRSAALHSRTFVPADARPKSYDRRSLGVCVTRLQIDGDDMPLDAAFGAGWHGADTDGTRFWRWTDGATPLPAKARAVLVDLGGPGAYWLEEPALPLAHVA